MGIRILDSLLFLECINDFHISPFRYDADYFAEVTNILFDSCDLWSIENVFNSKLKSTNTTRTNTLPLNASKSLN